MQPAIVRIIKRRELLRATNKEFERAGLPCLPIRVSHSQEPRTPTDIVLRKSAGGYDVLINQFLLGRGMRGIKNKVASYLHWFSQTSEAVREIVVDASDGDHPTFADYKFSSASAKHTLLPDAHFFRDHGYAETDRIAKEEPVAWHDRSDDITWRGRANGQGLCTLDDDTIEKPGVIQRLHMAKKCQALGVDFRFVHSPGEPDRPFYEAAGLIGEFIPVHDWRYKKFAVDIDGYSNAWCNFMQRLKLGCCVLKVDSSFGYSQWYYDKIKPWEHYVPIRADLSDLADQVEWARSNPDKAHEIAQNAQAFARQLTFKSETQYAQRAIEEREALR
jgi:hypothetical protein